MPHIGSLACQLVLIALPPYQSACCSLHPASGGFLFGLPTARLALVQVSAAWQDRCNEHVMRVCSCWGGCIQRGYVTALVGMLRADSSIRKSGKARQTQHECICFRDLVYAVMCSISAPGISSLPIQLRLATTIMIVILVGTRFYIILLAFFLMYLYFLQILICCRWSFRPSALCQRYCSRNRRSGLRTGQLELREPQGAQQHRRTRFANRGRARPGKKHS